VFESCGITRIHKDGQRAYMETNKGDTDLSRLVVFDPATGKEEVVESDPLGKVDFGNPVFSEATDELVGTSYEDERPRLYFRDNAYEADYKLLQQKLPGRETKALTPQYTIRERIPRDQMASVKAIRYPSSDGLSIPAFLTLPKGVPA